MINTPSPTVAPLSTVPVVQLAPPPALPPRDQMKQISSKTGAISPALENNNNPFNNVFKKDGEHLRQLERSNFRMISLKQLERSSFEMILKK